MKKILFLFGIFLSMQSGATVSITVENQSSNPISGTFNIANAGDWVNMGGQVPFNLPLGSQQSYKLTMWNDVNACA